MLVGDNLIWLAQDRRRVHVLDLRLFTTKTFIPVTRESIGIACAADEVVAFTAHFRGTVYVGELNGQGPLKSFRFINTSLNFALTCRHRTVACAGYLEDSLLVYIWNYDTQQGKSFNVNNHTPVSLGNQLHISILQTELGLLLQPDTETIVLCLFVPSHCQRNPGDNPQVLYYRFTYAGECLHGANQVLEGYYGDDINAESGDRRSIRFIPASHDGLFMLQRKVWRNAHAIKTIHTLQFDERLQAFTSPRHPRLYPTDPQDQGNIVWWKDAFVEAGTEEYIVVHRGTTSDPCYEPVMAYSPSKPMQGSVREWQVNFKELLINDRYIVRPYCNVFYVYCYDHTVQLPGKEGTLNGVGPWEVIEPKFASVSECLEGTDNT